MAVIHRTTLRPTKLELLAAWLPTREWYSAAVAAPEKAGGFRLDDPAGEVGIEFMVVGDAERPADAPHLVPMTYRAAPLDGAEDALIGTAEHGVLGKRWIYDGTHDPVLVTELYALLAGRAEPQAQSESDTPDPTVHASLRGAADGGTVLELLRVVDGADRTDMVVRTSGAAEPVTLRLRRVLGTAAGDTPARGTVTAGWRLSDGTTARGPYVLVPEDAETR
jgi:hypothetical protein